MNPFTILAVRIGAVLLALPGPAPASAAEVPSPQPPVALGSRLELFVDDLLIERLDGCALRLHEPRPVNVALRFDAPWEGAFCGYVTVLHR